jgi:general secretion pathway protein H
MRIDACKQKGLSLLELLVVLLVIGTLVGYAIPAFISEDVDSQISDEAHRLSTLLRLARDEAVLNAREYAVEFSEDSYTFHVLGEGERWLPLEQETVFRRRTMPSAIRMDVLIMGEDMTIETGSGSYAARVFMLSSGEMTPFEIRLQAEEAAHPFHVTGSAAGEIRIVTAGEPA